jgi:hypothetical protein
MSDSMVLPALGLLRKPAGASSLATKAANRKERIRFDTNQRFKSI